MRKMVYRAPDVPSMEDSMTWARCEMSIAGSDGSSFVLRY